MTFEKNIKVELTDTAFRRVDETEDSVFYKIPRFVTHIDADAVAAVTRLYASFLPGNSTVLDLMSSWVSHYPEDQVFNTVVGLGLNARELARNKQLTETVVQDLNQNTELPFQDNTFDACTICVSIDYLTSPVTILKEVGRVLKSNAPLIITYSNRFFETKAIAAWLSLSEHDRKYLIRTFLLETGVFKDIEYRDCSPGTGDPLYAITALSL